MKEHADLPDSPGALAERIREDVRQCAALLSRARQHGEQSPQYQEAQAAWRHRQAIIDALAVEQETSREDIELHRVAAYDVIAAARTVRADLLQREADQDDAGRRFLESTAFLDAPTELADGLPEWSPEPPGWAG
ncbi:hypothetical protein OG897_39840 [Streptomyces sp. NBC_00237]|uniref:hypothetical protein n=1 Tax=Streptomyces sp. NBC_00237 TaxID=2975687 RepID=UPI002253E73C|nr:hypothetical protein [Streptomyces sp. NBC_00237]MCX5207544.1 hypothetical protein [Streptomyces sp. NBC_00237]